MHQGTIIKQIAANSFFKPNNELNLQTTSFSFNIDTTLSRGELATAACKQFPNIENIFLLETKGSIQILEKNDFEACQNTSLNNVTFSMLYETDRALTLKPYFTDFIPKLNYIFLEDAYFYLISNEAFSRTSKVQNLTINLGISAANIVEPKAFVKTNSELTVIKMERSFLLIKFPEAFTNFFDESESNFVEVLMKDPDELICDCSLYWLYQRKEHISKVSNESLPCKDGRYFLDLTYYDFFNCTYILIKKILPFYKYYY